MSKSKVHMPKELKKMYCAAYRDALRGKKGLHPVCRCGTGNVCMAEWNIHRVCGG